MKNPFARLLSAIRIDRDRIEIYASYLAAISECRSRVWITQAYFAPDPEFLEVLANAALRGCDVRLLVPANSDVGLLLHASRDQYAGLLEAGVRIFEYEGPVLHAKTAVVDGVWSTVGLEQTSTTGASSTTTRPTRSSSAGVRHRDGAHVPKRPGVRARSELETWPARPLRDRVMQPLAGALKYWI